MPQFPGRIVSKLPHVGTTIFTVMSRLAAEHNPINLSQGFPDFDCARELRADREAFAARLRHWLAHWEEGRTAEQARQFGQSREKRIDIYLAIAQTLTPVQRTHLANRVQGYIGDFTQLAER